MEQKQRVYIYDRKELIILSVLGVFLAAFAFTLGIHMGKRLVSPRTTAEHVAGEAPAVGTVADVTPNRQELAEQGKSVNEAVDETLNRALHEEVVRTGIKMDQPKQVELPRHAKSENAGATTLAHTKQAEKILKKLDRSDSNFILQVGSFPELEEAKHHIQKMESHGLKPQMKVAEIPGKGVWYRLFLTGFQSHDAADQAGAKYRSEKIIDSYIVSKQGD